MNPDYKCGYVKTDGDNINLYSSDNEIYELYNTLTSKVGRPGICMCPDLYNPSVEEQPVRYLIHSEGIIIVRV